MIAVSALASPLTHWLHSEFLNIRGAYAICVCECGRVCIHTWCTSGGWCFSTVYFTLCPCHTLHNANTHPSGLRCATAPKRSKTFCVDSSEGDGVAAPGTDTRDYWVHTIHWFHMMGRSNSFIHLLASCLLFDCVSCLIVCSLRFCFPCGCDSIEQNYLCFVRELTVSSRSRTYRTWQWFN